MFHLFLVLIALLAPLISGQTQEQIYACSRTLKLEDYVSSYRWSTTDNVNKYNATYTYDPALCADTKIPVTFIRLFDTITEGWRTCTFKQFDQTGILHTVCPQTLGELALIAQEGDNGDEDDFFISLSFGQRPSVYRFDIYFDVQPYTPPAPSGQISKRRINKRHQCDIPGFNFCRTGSKTFDCIDTSSSLYSCGACPESEESRDCTAIDGADRVECRSSECFVHTCLRGYQVSSDRRGCIPSNALNINPHRRK